MCGIYGYVGEAKKPEVLNKLMRIIGIISEVRGVDGTGFLAISDDELITEKAPIKASLFFETSEYFHEAIVEKRCRIFIGHNRAASVGEVNVKNTQPFVGDKWAMVHNGTMGDDAFDLAQEMRVKSKVEGDTDTEAFFRCIEKADSFNGDLLPKVESYSFIAVNFIDKELYFARDWHRPMCVVDLRKELGVRIFCSTLQIVQEAVNYTNKAGLTNIEVKKMKHFFTKPLHGYTVDLDSLEFNNTGRYEEDPVLEEEEPEVVDSTIKRAVSKVLGFGRRGYPASAIDLGNPPPARTEYGE